MKSFSDSTSGTFAKFVFKLHSYIRTIGSSHLPTIQNKKLNIQNLCTIPLTPSPLNPLIPRRLPAAFSLTEVVIAMGVAAVAFTSIIALFPLGLNMSKESYEATQAALIAQTIMADLNDALSTKDTNNNYAKLIQIKGDTFAFDAQNYTKINLSGNTDTTFYLAYDETVRSNSTLKPILIRPSAFSTAPNAFYTDGTNGAFAVVKVIISQTFLLGSGGMGNPQKIDVWVETPGKFRDTNRVQFLFTGAIPQS